MESVQFILINNNFKFNDEFFLQLTGTAMGTDMAPTYATLTMGYHELEFYEICQINWGRAFRKYIEILLEEDKVHPNALLEVLNSISPNIQFTMTCSKKMVPFLDVLIRKEQSIIWTDLYVKPADTRRYLPFSSSHPKSCKVNIPFCLARQICKIVENVSAKEKHLREWKQIMLQQNYPLSVIDHGITKAKQIPHAELRRPKDRDDNGKILPFVTTFNPNNPSVCAIIRYTFESL